MKWSALNYAEAALTVFALLFGSLIYEQFGVSNIFINVAIIALVASPIVLNRFFLEAGLSKRSMQAVVGGYAACGVVTSIALSGGNASDYLFVPIVCAISLPLLQRLSNQSTVQRSVQPGH
jgi:hypothetical protein